MDALQRLAAGRTSLFVAHRLSTAAQCDQIVVLEEVSNALISHPCDITDLHQKWRTERIREETIIRKDSTNDPRSVCSMLSVIQFKCARCHGAHRTCMTVVVATEDPVGGSCVTGQSSRVYISVRVCMIGLSTLYRKHGSVWPRSIQRVHAGFD